MKKVLLTVACVLLCASCIRYEYKFHYISLEKIEGICIKSLGRLNRSDIKEDHDMPMRYELKRENYLLVFEVGDYHRPNLLVSPRSPNGDSLMLEPIKIGNCSYLDDPYNDYLDDPYYEMDGMEAWRYVWIPSSDSNCPAKDGESYPPHQIIGFRVKNREGDVLGEERLPFDLVRNGFYYEIGAI